MYRREQNVTHPISKALQWLAWKRGNDEVSYFYVGEVFCIHLGTKYANFQEKIFAEISGKKLKTFHFSSFLPEISAKIFFLKIGILRGKVYTKNVYGYSPYAPSKLHFIYETLGQGGILKFLIWQKLCQGAAIGTIRWPIGVAWPILGLYFLLWERPFIGK